MTGTVTQIKGKQQSFCLITSTAGVEYFAHRMDFVTPELMKVGTPVEFREKLAKTGPRPSATDVVAA